MIRAFLVASAIYSEDSMKRLLALVVVATGLLHAEVFMSAHGKTYHKSQDCMSLKRASVVYSADEADAKAHGLHQCAICNRERKTGSASGASSWAKESKRKESK
jgi:hypothetical protein